MTNTYFNMRQEVNVCVPCNRHRIAMTSLFKGASDSSVKQYSWCLHIEFVTLLWKRGPISSIVSVQAQNKWNSSKNLLWQWFTSRGVERVCYDTFPHSQSNWLQNTNQVPKCSLLLLLLLVLSFFCCWFLVFCCCCWFLVFFCCCCCCCLWCLPHGSLCLT